MRHFTCIASLALCASASAAQFKIGAHNFTLPGGYEIELVAGTDLVPRPIEADFDEQGRLYVTDSSGSNDKVEKQLAEKPHRVVRLEDTDGDGRFDKSIVFADKMMFPEGCMWLDGSLYVAAPPSIWKLTDTNSDGVADVRVEWFQGKTLTGCANDLHGPYAGPDGWIYWCKGAFAKQTYTLPNGKEFTTRASHIFRARPDGTGVEPVMTGGMDNPVGVVFTPEGDRILSGTFFQNPEGGKRDGLIHAIYGGVYGKVNDVLDGHTRTGDLLPMMTHLGAAAPAGLMRYESDAFGKGFQNNLFVACFNMHKIVRCVMEPSGATYKTTDTDFLVSDNTDFHPTDVLEDADGSLLVVNTGGWYKLCCPTSQLQKPDVLGGIYRIRRAGAPKSGVMRGWQTKSVEEFLANPSTWTDPRVVRRAMPVSGAAPFAWKRLFDEMVKRGAAAVPLLSAISTNTSHYRSEVRVGAVWSLTRIDGESAREAVRSLIPDRAPQIRQISIHVRDSDYAPDVPVIHAALNSVSAHRDSGAFGKLTNLVTWAPDALRRSAVEALGRIGDPRAVAALLKSTADWQPLFARPSIVSSRSFEPGFLHSIIYALIEIADPKSTAVGLDSENHLTRRAALIALDQMPSGDLKPEQVTPLLASNDPLLKETASWIVGRHSEWGDSLAAFFGERLNAPGLGESGRAELQQQLERFARNTAIQNLLVKTISSGDSAARVIALRALARAGVKEMPAAWVAPLTACLQQSDPQLLAAAVSLSRAVPVAKTSATEINAALIQVAERTDLPPAICLAAAAAVSGGIRNLGEPLYQRLLAALAPERPVNERSDAALALANARLGDARLRDVAAYLKGVGPMELPRLLPAFAQSTNEAVGMTLIESLQSAKAVQSVRAETLNPAITNFPSNVRQRADELLASLNTDAKQQNAHVDELLVSAKNGDVRRGQALFNSTKAACSACHAIGYLGGKVGPDLTRIGQVRNERDLLEALVYPNASFVRSYEPVIVSTKSGEEVSGVLRKDGADEVVLATGPETEQRIARSDVADMRPGSVSVMPSGLAEQLTKEELGDLLAFLKATRW